MTFPRFKMNVTEDDTPAEVLEGRARFAAGPLAQKTRHPDFDLDVSIATPEGVAEAFGRDMFARCGKDWPRMIGLASRAAMQAERDAMGDA